MLTIVIMIMIVFVLGFIADPIINMYMDPWSFLSPFSRADHYYYEDDDPVGWTEHFAKGFASMGVIGFLKMILASPIAYFRFGGGRGRTTARDRYEQISWLVIAIGVFTFMAVCTQLLRFRPHSWLLTFSGGLQRCTSLEPANTRESWRASHGCPWRRWRWWWWELAQFKFDFMHLRLFLSGVSETLYLASHTFPHIL